MTTVIKDIETFFSNTETAISSKLSEVVGALKNASSDVIKKTVAIAHVAEHLAETFAADVDNTWEKLDAQTTPDIIASVVDNLNSKNFETAALGVIYLIYQSAVEATNKVEEVATPIVTEVVNDVKADVQVAETKVEGVLQKVEGEISRVWVDGKVFVEDVVHKVEDLFTSNSTPVQAAPVAAPVTQPVVAPAPEVAAAVVPPQPQPVPVQAPVATIPVLAS